MKMTMGQLRRIIRETIHETEFGYSINEAGFMDKVKGFFGGGIEAASSGYNRILPALIMKKVGSWGELRDHIKSTLTFKVLRRFEGIISACETEGYSSVAGFLQPLWQALHKIIKNPDPIFYDEDDRESFINGGKAAKKGDTGEAMSVLRYIFESNPHAIDALYEAFKAEPSAQSYLRAAGETSGGDKKAKQGDTGNKKNGPGNKQGGRSFWSQSPQAAAMRRDGIDG